MTRILPDIAPVLSAPLARRHAPVITAEHERAYEEFRRCLRWELGFGCPFCLLHEAQVCPGGVIGSSQFWIEHLEPQAARPELRNVYGNVVYACRRCNLARRFLPRIDLQGRRLLDPCGDAWSVHFKYDGDALVALSSNGDYTATAYDINAPAKLALRRERREAITEALHVLATVPALLSQLMQGIDFQPDAEQRLRLEVAEHMGKSLAAARRTLLQLAAVPHDASPECACDDPAVCQLPPAVAVTLWHVELDPGLQ